MTMPMMEIVFKLETAITTGGKILIDNIEETIDPVFDTVIGFI
jgi:hypothetical protein